MARIHQQIIPIGTIIVLSIGALIAARQRFVPESFGDLGHYRANAIDEIAAQEPVYAGIEACGECHDEIYELKQASNHRGVACEVCHGPGAAHIEEPDEVALEAPRGRGFCPLCHGYNPSRPSGFPQILPVQHNPGKACMSCHEPHNPLLPRTPEECSACHRDIANVKIVSHHATLSCSDCHDVPDKHRIEPHNTRANKPVSSRTCAVCHQKGADGTEKAPQIDIVTHTGRYLCWDCHYPHYPEAQ